MRQIDAEHRGPLVNIAAWITLVALVLVIAGKVTTKWKMIRKFQSDDTLMVLAMSTAVGYCVTTAVQVQSGLGQPKKALDSHQFKRYEKSAYASQFLYILTLYIAKMAALQFLILLSRPDGSGRLNWRQTSVKGIMVCIMMWLVIAILCISFQCAVPDPWDQASRRCFDQLAFWTTNGVIDICTQLYIGLAPIYLLFNVHLPVAKKLPAMLSFTPNLTTIPLAVLRLVYLNNVIHSPDTTIKAVNVALVTVIHTNYCIIASCLPFLKPLIDSLAIGLLTNDIRVPVRSEDSIKDKSKMNPFAILSGGKRFHTRNAYGWTRFPASSDYTSTVTSGKENNIELANLEKYGSQERMVINQTKTTVVSSDPKPIWQ